MQFGRRECRSEEYRQAYVEYQSRPKARVTNHEISYEWKDGEMWLDSRMTLQNRNQERLSEIVLYLNPSLEIYSLKEAGNDMGYHRDQQVVVLERQLLPVIPFFCISPIKVKLMRRYATWMCLLKSGIM